ncbi:MAG: Asp-tRNA(Asn)/Glu-tRNA(Gln) amidotransferase subunit GatA [Hydrotalea sp.]|nr:Asp-tRNA(Asn)/Glu-tRNA(Gln) amidotransferase subunit GatA [Hydrotalea sp.]
MDKKQILSLDMVGAVTALRNMEISAVELTQTYLDEIAARNDTLNAYITVTPDRALADAKQADKDIADKNFKDLTGIPLGIKDLFCTKGIYTTAASKMLADFVPPYESTVTQKLWDAGAVCLGKTNMDEFAMGSTTSTGYHREKKRVVPTINPWSPNLWTKNFNMERDPLTAGGSSGGSAAAVAGLMALGATGSDTGGSIRQPCAFTGLVGVKPTYGRCSRYGMVAFASSLDQAGVMTRSVRDAALMLGVIAGHDQRDSTSANLPVPKKQWLDAVEKGKNEGLKGLRVGYLGGANSEIFNLLTKKYEKIKCLDIANEYLQVKEKFNNGISTYYIIAPAEAASNLARYDGVRYGLRSDGKNLNDMYENTRRDGFGNEVKRRILIGNYVLSAGYYDAYFKKAQQIRRMMCEEFFKLFRDYDVILLPTTNTYGAFALNTKFSDPTEIYKQDFLTIPASLAGVPAGVLPLPPRREGVLPAGLQVICKHYDEATMFRVMGALEQAFNIPTTDNLLKRNNIT